MMTVTSCGATLGCAGARGGSLASGIESLVRRVEGVLSCVLATVAAVACSPFGADTEPADAAAAADAGDAGDAGAAATTVTLFAQDFESAAQAPFGFDKVDDEDAATSAVTAAPGRPGTKALQVLLHNEASQRGYAFVKELGIAPLAPSRITLEVDVRVERTDLQYVALAVVGVTGNDFAGFVGVAAYAAADMMGGLAPLAPLNPTPIKVQRGQWRRVVADLDILPTSRRYVVRIDGTVVEDRVLGAQPEGARLDVRIGCVFTSDNLGGAEVYFDNLTVRATSL